MADSKLRVILSLVDKLTPNLRKTQKGVDKTTSSLNKMATGLKKSEKGVGGLTKSLQGMAVGLVAGIGALAAIRKALSITKEAALLNARFETMGVVVDNLGKNVGRSAAEMRDLEKGLEETGISMIGARESIARLIQANIDLSHATDLARVAQDGAVIAGTNSTAAFEKLVGFISTGNIRVARQIGLFIDLRTAYKDWAKENDRTVASLTEQEKTQIRANAAVAAGSQITGTYEAAMKTAGKQLGSMERDVENLKVTMGALFNEMLTSGVPTARKFTQELTALFEALDKLQGKTLKAKGSVDFLDLAMKAMGVDVDTLRGGWEGLVEVAEDYVGVSTLVAPALSDEQKAFARLRNTVEEFGEELEETPEQIKLLEDALARASAAGEALRSALTDPIKVKVSVDAPDMIQQLGLKELGIDNIEDTIPLIMSPSLDREAATKFAQEAELLEVAAQVRVEQIEIDEAIKQLVADGIAPDATQAMAILQPLLDASPAQFNTMGQILKSELINAVNDGRAEMTAALQSAFRPAVSPLMDAVDAVKALDGSTIDVNINYIGGPGFQHGGSFIVPGSGGPDSTPVGFMATPGERVTVDSGDHSTLSGATLNINMSGISDVDSFLEELGLRTRQAVSSLAAHSGAQ